MQYLLLIYDNESLFANMKPADTAAIMQDYGKFSQEITASGQFKGANRLQSVANATTVRIRDGKRTVTNGPFAETKEQLGGYYLIEAKDLDEAIAVAAKIPSARVGSIEVRPIWDMSRPATA